MKKWNKSEIIEVTKKEVTAKVESLTPEQIHAAAAKLERSELKMRKEVIERIKTYTDTVSMLANMLDAADTKEKREEIIPVLFFIPKRGYEKQSWKCTNKNVQHQKRLFYIIYLNTQ